MARSPQEIRNIRLENDYKEMLNIRGNIISWKATKGVAPFVEEYEITINVNTIINNVPNYRNQQVVKITLPAGYPTSQPTTEMLTQPQPFHPNWYTGGRWCSGDWNMSEGLGHHVIRMVRTLQFDRDITNEYSPANREANEWYKQHKNSNRFPCDTQILPDPTKARMVIKKTFNIRK